MTYTLQYTAMSGCFYNYNRCPLCIGTKIYAVYKGFLDSLMNIPFNHIVMCNASYICLEYIGVIYVIISGTSIVNFNVSIYIVTWCFRVVSNGMQYNTLQWIVGSAWLHTACAQPISPNCGHTTLTKGYL